MITIVRVDALGIVRTDAIAFGLVGHACVVLEADELSRVDRVIDAFQRAGADGSAAVRVDRRFVGCPISRLARKRRLRYQAFEERIP